MDKTVLVTKSVGNIQTQLFATKVFYECHYVSGPLSAQHCEANNLFHHLVRTELDNLLDIRFEIWSRYAFTPLYLRTAPNPCLSMEL